MKIYTKEMISQVFGTTDATEAQVCNKISIDQANFEVKETELQIKLRDMKLKENKYANIDLPASVAKLASMKIIDELNQEKIKAMKNKPEEPTEPATGTEPAVV